MKDKVLEALRSGFTDKFKSELNRKKLLVLTTYKTKESNYIWAVGFRSCLSDYKFIELGNDGEPNICSEELKQLGVSFDVQENIINIVPLNKNVSVLEYEDQDGQEFISAIVSVGETELPLGVILK